MIKKLHNPKSFAPSVYIPCWLIQIPVNLLSHAAKMTYGRLSQWANESGTVYRSCTQLSEELGCSVRSIKYHLEELKQVGLIGTFHPQAGGINHFEFYDHPWMYEPIKEQLVYKQDNNQPNNPVVHPVQECAQPSARSCTTPVQDLALINIKEIKTRKDSYSASVDAQEIEHSFFEQFWAAYPLKKNKVRSSRIWRRKNLDTILPLILADISNRKKKDPQWSDPQFIPHPATYLGNELWNDEIPTPKPKPSTAQERAINEQRIREREIKAQEDKKREVEASHVLPLVINKAKAHISFQERLDKLQEEKRKLNMDSHEYHNHISRNTE